MLFSAHSSTAEGVGALETPGCRGPAMLEDRIIPEPATEVLTHASLACLPCGNGSPCRYLSAVAKN